MDTVFRPYSSKILANDRKQVLIKDTLELVAKATGAFFKFLVASYGSITYSMLENWFIKEYEKDENQVNLGLVSAQNWFMPMEQGLVPEKFQILPIDAIKKFYNYCVESNEYVNQYLNSNLSEGFVWIDCFEYFKHFCKTINCSENDFRNDVACMIREKMIFVNSTNTSEDMAEGWQTISSMFGTGDKEDRKEKSECLRKVISFLSANKEVSTWEDYKERFIRYFNVKCYQEIYKKYAGTAQGRPPAFLNPFFNEKYIGNISGNQINNYIKGVENKLKEKSENIVFSTNKKIEDFLQKEIGMQFDQRLWSESFKAAMSAILQKRPQNYTYAVNQSDNKIKLEELRKVLGNNIGILEKFFDSPFYKGKKEDVFIIDQRSVKNLDKLYEIWEDSDMDEGIQQFIENESDRCRVIVNKSIYEYIYNCADAAADTFIKDAEYNGLREKHRKQKVHPIVIGRPQPTFSKGSAMDGEICNPRKKYNGVFNGQNNIIWINISLYHKDKNEFIDHHVPFCNSRYYEEVYAFSDMVDESTKKQRTARLGNNSGIGIHSELLPINSKKHKKAIKRYLRTKTNLKENVVFPSNASFNLYMKDGMPWITVNHKFTVPKIAKELNVGDSFLGYDLNQTAPNTYWIGKVVKNGTENSKTYCGLSIQIIGSGKIKSVVKANNREIDQLSYGGTSNFSPWKKERMKFIRLNDGEIKDIRCDKIYQFNAKYAVLLKKQIKNLANESNFSEYRKEIFDFMVNNPASILNLGSLSQICLDCLQTSKSILNTFSRLLFNEVRGKDEKFTIDVMEKIDKEIFDLHVKITNKITLKRKERVRRIVAGIIDIATANKAKMIFGEGDIGKSSKGTKKSMNKRTIDWCARAISQKMADCLRCFGISWFAVAPHYTSHQDPFIHVPDENVAMKARYNAVKPKEIVEFHLKKLSYYLKGKSSSSTTVEYYKKATETFFSNYGIEEIKHKINSIKFYDLHKLLNGHEVVYVPMKGGRFYFATYPVTTNATKFMFNGEQVYICDADEVAAANIALAGVRLVTKPRAVK